MKKITGHQRVADNQIKLTHVKMQYFRARRHLNVSHESLASHAPRPFHPIRFSFFLSLSLLPPSSATTTNNRNISARNSKDAATGLVSNEKAVHRPIPTRPTFPRPSKQCERSATYQMIHAHAHPRGKRGGGDGARGYARVTHTAVTQIRCFEGPPFPPRLVNFGKKEHLKRRCTPRGGRGSRLDRCSINIESN